MTADGRVVLGRCLAEIAPGGLDSGWKRGGRIFCLMRNLSDGVGWDGIEMIDRSIGW